LEHSWQTPGGISHQLQVYQSRAKLQASLARRAMVIQLFCRSIASRYDDSSYNSGEALLPNDMQSAERQQVLLKAFLRLPGKIGD